jgi:hypothetical protein
MQKSYYWMEISQGRELRLRVQLLMGCSFSGVHSALTLFVVEFPCRILIFVKMLWFNDYYFECLFPYHCSPDDNTKLYDIDFHCLGPVANPYTCMYLISLTFEGLITISFAPLLILTSLRWCGDVGCVICIS